MEGLGVCFTPTHLLWRRDSRPCVQHNAGGRAGVRSAPEKGTRQGLSVIDLLENADLEIAVSATEGRLADTPNLLRATSRGHSAFEFVTFEIKPVVPGFRLLAGCVSSSCG